MKGTERFMSLQTSVVLTEECNVMVNREELLVIGTTEYLSVYTTCHVTGFDCVSNYSSKKNQGYGIVIFSSLPVETHHLIYW
jgi:hypothetical protein